MDCADKSRLEDSADELIATDIISGDSIDFAEDAAGILIASINDGN